MITVDSLLVTKCLAYTLSLVIPCNFAPINLLDSLVQYLANVLLISTLNLQHITQPLLWIYCYLLLTSSSSIITNNSIDQQEIVSSIN